MGAEAGFLALLAAIGLGGAALLVARSRRRRSDIEEDEAFAMEPVPAPAPAVSPASAVPAMPAMAMYAPEPAFIPEMAPARSTAPRASAEVPAGPIPQGEERHALLRRMAAAEPDEANPFRSRKARLRRARLILQRLEHERGAKNEPGFDWRTYRPNRVETPEPVTV